MSYLSFCGKLVGLLGEYDWLLVAMCHLQGHKDVRMGSLLSVEGNDDSILISFSVHGSSLMANVSPDSFLERQRFEGPHVAAYLCTTAPLPYGFSSHNITLVIWLFQRHKFEGARKTCRIVDVQTNHHSGSVSPSD